MNQHFIQQKTGRTKYNTQAKFPTKTVYNIFHATLKSIIRLFLSFTLLRSSVTPTAHWSHHQSHQSISGPGWWMSAAATECRVLKSFQDRDDEVVCDVCKHVSLKIIETSTLELKV